MNEKEGSEEVERSRNKFFAAPQLSISFEECLNFQVIGSSESESTNWLLAAPG